MSIVIFVLLQSPAYFKRSNTLKVSGVLLLLQAVMQQTGELKILLPPSGHLIYEAWKCCCLWHGIFLIHWLGPAGQIFVSKISAYSHLHLCFFNAFDLLFLFPPWTLPRLGELIGYFLCRPCMWSLACASVTALVWWCRLSSPPKQRWFVLEFCL